MRFRISSGTGARSFATTSTRVQPGDVIMSGTLAGVGPVQRGAKLEGHVDGVGDLTVTYAKQLDHSNPFPFRT